MTFTAALTVLFLVAWVYQVAVYSYFGYQLLRYPLSKGNGSQDQSAEGVSIIVCAHNERTNLSVLLPILLSQRYAPYEVIVADDASEDGTQQMIAEQQRRHPNLRIVRIEQRPVDMQSKKYALTQAIRSALYDRLLLTDADCRPASDTWLSQMVEPLVGATGFVLGYSPYFKHPGWLNAFIRYETLHTGMLYTAAALAGHPYMSVGRNLAYRRLLFVQQRGFDRHKSVVGGDDDLWVNQAADQHNTTVVLAKSALVYSLPKTDLKSYLRQKIRHLSVGRHYRIRDKLWLGLLSLSTVVVWLVGGLLMFLCNKCMVVATLFLLRWFILAAVFSIACRRLHDPINLRWLPILDFLHVIYYGVVGTLAFSTKHIRWKN